MGRRNKLSNFAFVILGNGRKGYLERTIASWETNLIDAPKYKAIFDDSGNSEYRNWLKQTYGDRFSIYAVDFVPAGQAKAVQSMFDYIKNLDVDYVVWTEEDWVLFRSLDTKEIFETLKQNINVLQMRIPRTIWYADYHLFDLNAGSLLLDYIEDKNAGWSYDKWFNVKTSHYFWSHNPCVFLKDIVNNPYPTDGDHEFKFGTALLDSNPNATVGFWANNPYDGYVTHIGIKSTLVLNSLRTHKPLNYLGYNNTR